MARYKANSDGRILDNEIVIGTFDPATGLMTLPENLSEVARTHIKAQVFDIMMAKRAELPPDPGRDFDRPQGKTLIEVFTNEQADSQQDVLSRDDIAPPPPPPRIPPEPPQDPKFGDKTPAWMQWLGTYFPEKYRERFKGRKTHLTTGINPHMGGGDIPESHMARDPAEEWR